MSATAHRLDAERYGAIVESGALEDQRVELIDGIISEMNPVSPLHDLLVQRLTAHCAGVAAGPRIQLSLRAADDSVLQPDLAVLESPPRADRHPTTAVLVVEVSVTSHALDRGRKAELYAAARIPTYWLVDAVAGVVELRTDPGPDGYRTLRTLGRDEVLPSPCEGVGELSVADLMRGI